MTIPVDLMVERAERDLEAWRAIKENYPSAVLHELPNGRPAVLVSEIDPTGFELVIRPPRGPDPATVILCPYTNVGTVRVYISRGAWQEGESFFERMRVNRPEQYKEILEKWE